jgi:sugar lactone lactonase YvrE
VDVALGPSGDLYIADAEFCRVLRVASATGRLEIVAGSGRCGFAGDGGPASRAMLGTPGGLAVDTRGAVYVADRGNDRIRKVDLRSGLISTIAGSGTQGFDGDGGPALAASLSSPSGLAVDSRGSVYFADTGNARVRRISPEGRIETVLGPGLGDEAGPLDSPADVAFDDAGRLFVADAGNKRIVVLEPATRVVRVVAAGGGNETYWAFDNPPALHSALGGPSSLAVDQRRNVFIADTERSCVWKLDANSERLRVVAGYRSSAGNDPGYWGEQRPAREARLDRPRGVAIDVAGNLYVADTENRRVRKVDGRTGLISTAAGNGTATWSGDGEPAGRARLRSPEGVAVDGAGALYVADTGNGVLRKVDPVDGLVLTVVGADPRAEGAFGGGWTPPDLDHPHGVAVDRSGNVLVAENNIVRRRSADMARTLIVVGGHGGREDSSGDGGPARDARLNEPSGLAFDSSGNFFVADLYNDRIRRVDGESGMISTFAGSGLRLTLGDGGPAIDAGIYGPSGVAVDPSGRVLIADTVNHRVRRVDPGTGIITTIAGNARTGGRDEGAFSGDGGPAARAGLNQPMGVAADAQGNIYIADTGNHRVRRIDVATGLISTVAGTGTPGDSGDGGAAAEARLNGPRGVAVGPDGVVYVADTGNDRVRALVYPGGAHVPFLRSILGPRGAADASEMSSIKRTCELLVRHLPALNEEGEARLRFHGHRYVATLLRELASADHERETQATRCLRLIVSPFARGQEASKRHAGHMGLLRVRRPCGSARQHPEAAAVRGDATALLARLVGAPSAPSHDEALWATRDLLVEVGDDETLRSLEVLLRRADTEPSWDLLMNAMAAIHGVPQQYAGGFIDCGNTGPDERERFEKVEALKRKPRRQEFLEWHGQMLRATPEARLGQALYMWQGTIHNAGVSGDRTPLENSDFLALLRLGAPAVPLLKEWGDQATTGAARAGSALAVAAITGQVDDELVSELLSSGADGETSLGIEMILAAGSRQWRDELARLQAKAGRVGRKASQALAVCHLRDAIPLLRAAPKENSTAGYALKELEAGATQADW